MLRPPSRLAPARAPLPSLLGVLLLLAPLGAAPAPQEADLAGLVAALGADELGAREAAQLALAGRLLSLEAGSELAPLLEGASPGVRRRFALLLGAEDRLLRHAVELAVAGSAEVASVGRQAIDAQLLRWSRSAFDEPAVAVYDLPRQSTRLPAAWEDRASARVAVDPNAGGGVAAFDRLDLFGRGPAAVILDPQVVERMIRRPSPSLEALRVDGTWTEVLEALATVHGAAFQVQGFRYPEDERADGGADGRPPARSWIHVVGRGSTERAPIGRDLRASAGSVVVRWCVAVMREGNVLRQSAAARALAALDWAAAVYWFEERWQRTGDVVALEGLMAAAARGRVAPSLQRASSVRSILAFMDRESREVAALGRAVSEAEEAGELEDVAVQRAEFEEAKVGLDRRTARLAAGLAALAPITAGSPGAVGGASITPLFTAGFEQAPPSGRWARLVALEGLGVTDPVAEDLAVRVLTGDLDARSRRQALRVLLAVRPLLVAGRVSLPDPGALFLEASGRDVAGLGLELGLAQVRPAAGWTWDGATDAELVAELLVWAALTSEQDDASEPCPPWILETVRAALLLEEECRRFDRPGPMMLASRTVRGDLVRAFGALVRRTERELTPQEAAALVAVSLRAGLASPLEKRRALDRALLVLEGSRDEPAAVEGAWMDLAAVVGDPETGALALEVLEGSLVGALKVGIGRAEESSTALRQAAEAACAALDRARRDDLAERFSGNLRQVATMESHPLSDLFLDEAWPPSPPLPPRDLEQLSAPLPAR